MSAFDLTQTFVHLGLGVKATPMPDFAWTPDCLETYATFSEPDGDEGRLVCVTPQEETWDTWELHPAGEEMVYLISGRIDIIQDLDDGERRSSGHSVTS